MKNNYTMKPFLRTRRIQRRVEKLIFCIMVIAIFTSLYAVNETPQREYSAVVQDWPAHGTQENMRRFANQFGEGWQRMY